LSETYQLPATVANDAVCAAYGEYRFGAGQGSRAMLGIVVSTGVGGGLIVDGRPHQGPTGNAGHIGHTVADPAGERCGCGRRGCVELYASGPWMVTRARRAGWASRPDATAADLAHAATEGDEHALAVFDAAGRALAAAIVSAAALVEVDRVVVGGGVAAAGSLLFGPIRSHVADLAGVEFAQRMRITPAGLASPRAGLLGAAALANVPGVDDQ
jgi:glucokinase